MNLNFENSFSFSASYSGLEKTFGMFWRFAPMSDAFVDEWHSRDLDAIIIQREVDAVKDWKKTDYAFHVMRDHPQHVTDILGGMFGVRQNTPKRREERREEFRKMSQEFGPKWKKGEDQRALAKIVSPQAAKDSLVHDSYLCQSEFLKGSQNKAFPSQRIIEANSSVPNFVGNTAKYGIEIECPTKCRPEDHQDWLYC